MFFLHQKFKPCGSCRLVIISDSKTAIYLALHYRGVIFVPTIVFYRIVL